MTKLKHTYVVLFNDVSNVWQKTKRDNWFLLRSLERRATDILANKGHLFLNEVYDMLDIQRTASGQLTGWVKEQTDAIFFGLPERIKDLDNNAIKLTFVTDGPILGALVPGYVNAVSNNILIETTGNEYQLRIWCDSKYDEGIKNIPGLWKVLDQRDFYGYLLIDIDHRYDPSKISNQIQALTLSSIGVVSEASASSGLKDGDRVTLKKTDDPVEPAFKVGDRVILKDDSYILSQRKEYVDGFSAWQFAMESYGGPRKLIGKEYVVVETDIKVPALNSDGTVVRLSWKNVYLDTLIKDEFGVHHLINKSLLKPRPIMFPEN